MDNFRKIQDRIMTEDIKPIPRWHYAFQNISIWTGFILFVLLGAIAFSIILYAVQQSDFHMMSHLSHSRMETLLALIPIIWLVGIIIFLTGSIFMIKNSKKGYKFSFFSLVSISVMMSIALGTLFFTTGGAQWIETKFGMQLETYESIEERKTQMWNNPSEGLLAGVIQESGISSFTIKDKNGKVWNITAEGSFVAPILLLEKGEKIKMIGEQLDKNIFKATEIRPWGGRRINGKIPGPNKKK